MTTSTLFFLVVLKASICDSGKWTCNITVSFMQPSASLWQHPLHLDLTELKVLPAFRTYLGRVAGQHQRSQVGGWLVSEVSSIIKCEEGILDSPPFNSIPIQGSRGPRMLKPDSRSTVLTENCSEPRRMGNSRPSNPNHSM